MSNDSTTLQGKISKLEADFLSGQANQATIKAQLVQAYIDGTDPAGLLSKLANLSAVLEGQKNALTSLDVQRFNLVKAEVDAEKIRLQKAFDRDVARFEDDLDRICKEHVLPLFTKAKIDVGESVTEAFQKLKDESWTGLRSALGVDQRALIVPKAPEPRTLA